MSDTPQPRPTQIKLLVNTANEAVSLIRERYGEQARVLSVKQLEPGGLKRLVSKPRLEVIVELPPEPQPQRSAGAAAKEAKPPAPKASPEAPRSEPSVEASNERNDGADTRGPSNAAPSKPNAIGNLYAKQQGESESSSYFSQFEEASSKPERRQRPAAEDEEGEEARLGSAANPVKRGTLDAVRRAVAMLESVGFDRSLIERIRSEIDFKDIGSLPTMDLYARICDWLRSRFPTTREVALAPRRAFIGCSGVGKTSALCKMLSAEVFLKEASPRVLKVDSDLPNPSDGLEVFCEIMGVGLARSIEEVEEASDEAPLLVDLPGMTLSDRASVDRCRDTLDELGIEERILVVNAAYEGELIAEMMAAGEAAGANKVVFTHLEETRRAGKLWKFLLNRRMQPLFFSEGPNPAGEYSMDPYSYLLERTFPNGRELAAASRRSRAPVRRQREEARIES